MMDGTFFKTSKKIANEFLQSVIFIDDEAFDSKENSDKSHELDAMAITNAFSKTQKICAVYNPMDESDINNLAATAKKADVTVIDWRINLKQDIQQDENEEEDVESDDPRGSHTIKIIQEILADVVSGNESLKLILVYTGDTDLKGITNEIYNRLQSVKGLKKEKFEVTAGKVRILVVGKPFIKAKHLPEIKKRIVPYSDLPDFILTEFTKMTVGLISNFVLKSLAVLRNNTSRLLRLFNKNLDPAFLSHRVLLANNEDSKQQLVEMLTHSIQALLDYYKTGEAASLENIMAWIETRDSSQKISISNKQLVVEKKFIKDWVKKGFVEACKSQWKKSGYGRLNKSQIDKFEKYEEKQLYKEGSKLFRTAAENENIDSEFSILTHHKSNVKQLSATPQLSLGTIIREEKKKSFYVCIQARCDSLRIENERRFLFLPIDSVEVGKKFDLVIEDTGSFLKLRLRKDTFEMRTIKFLPSNKEDSIIASKDGEGKFYFESIYKEKFIWFADLKDSHSQRIANDFASKMSRVGLGESEWLRRRANQH